MASPKYIALANITTTSTTTTVTFSNIPSTYRDLQLIANASGPGADNIIARFNGDSGVNYASVSMTATGTATNSGSTTYSEIYLSTMGTTRVLSEFHIFDYAQTDKHKATLSRGSDSTTYVFARANRWANTAAITSIAIIAPGNFTIGSSFTLYGVM